MPTPIIGVIGLILFLLLAVLGMPLAFAFASVGFIGILLVRGLSAGLSILGQAPYVWTSEVGLCAVPLFVLMGELAYHSGISQELYSAAYKWIGRLPGGLALATNLACTGFAACTGSSLASAVTMGTIAFPEMQRFNYNPRLSTGCITAGGTLGILIPPSIIFIIYGIITETSIIDLFIAGIFPGIMLSSLFLGLIFFMCRRNPKLGPPGEPFPWKERFASLSGVWGMAALFLLVVGGMYFGVFAPTEAGGIGAFGAFVIALVRRRLTRATLIPALRGAAQVTSFALLVLVGAMIFSTFLALTGLPRVLVDWVTSIPASPFVILIAICAFYVPLGCFMDALPMILLTIPIVFPIVTSLGFDPVWFGVLVCVLAELSLITPPVGINLYAVHGVTKVPLEEVVRGIFPFAIVFLIGITILIAFPQISLFLPYTMK